MRNRPVKTVNSALSRGRVDKGFKLGVSDGSLQNVVAGLGTDRDKMSYSQYIMPIALSVYQLTAMYRSAWLAQKTINIPCGDMTREWITYKFDDKDSSAEGVKKRAKDDRMFELETAEESLGLQKKVTDALKWGRLYGGCVLIMGTKQDLSTPLDPEKVKKDDLQYVLCVDKNRISPEGMSGSFMVTDPADPDFGLPAMYVLSESTVRVHHSRVIRFGGAELPWDAWVNNGYWDDSILQAPYAAMMNNDTATAAVATMMFEANVDVIKAEEMGNILAKKNGEQLLIKRFQMSQLMKSINRTLLLDATEEYDKKSNSFANLDKILEKFIVNYCGAVDIPVSRFFGQSATGLNANGDNDVRNYYDSIRNQQKTYLKPRLDKLFKVFVRSVLGTYPDDFRYEFNSLWQVSKTEQATIDKTNADRDKVYVDLGVVTEGTIAKDLKENGTYKNLTDEDVELVDRLSREALENPPEPVVPGVDPQGNPLPQPGGPGQPSPAKPAPAVPTGSKQ